MLKKYPKSLGKLFWISKKYQQSLRKLFLYFNKGTTKLVETNLDVKEVSIKVGIPFY
jgi:hypothetical protein